MLEIKNTKITNYEDEQKARGTGQLASRRELETKNIYDKFYNNLKKSNNPYLDDDMWAKAATRGELDQLIYGLNTSKDTNKYLDMLSEFGDKVDYDTYMLALTIPNLDNTTKKTRLDQTGTYNYGDMTDLEWAEKILESTKNKYTAEVIEENKDTMSFWQKAGASIVSGIGHIAKGVVNVTSNIYNLGEGIVYAFDPNKTFVEAFDNDDYLANVAEQVDYALYQLDMFTSARVDAIKAYEEGFDFYAVDADDISLGSKAFSEGIAKSNFGGGYTTWGRWWDSGLTSIGEMLPFMIIPAIKIPGHAKASKALTKIVKTGGFYTTNVFASSVSDTVRAARLNGISYKDMNVGQIIGNAALKSVAQYLMEIVTGKILGFTGLDKMMGVGEDVASGAAKWFTKAITAKGAKAVGVALGRGALSMVKEGLEETLQELSDNMIDLIFNKAVDGNMFSSNFSWQNLMDSFVVGALTSGVIGSLSSASVLINKKSRALAINEDGKAYRLGFFQQLNYNQAMEAMASWQAILDDAKATTQEKADAAFRIQGVALTIGNVLKTFGTERTTKALELLTAYQNKMSTEQQKAEAKLKLSDVSYAKDIYSDFVKGNVQVAAKYLNQVNEAKLQKALEKEAKLLKKNGVTKISDIVTQDLESTDTTIPEQSVKAVKELMKQTKSDMVIATDGTAVVTSESVIFAPDSLIKTGKVSEILEGIAYDKAIKAIAPELNKKQNDLILEEYQKISGRQDATIEDALIALLFDKSFYTYILLKTNESQKINDKNEAIKILAIIDSIVKGKISGDVDKGTLTQAAYQKLVERIQENMRAGLVVYAINYTNIDLDAISAEILPASYKELIRNNKNVIATNVVNKCLENKQKGVITQTRIEEFNRQIDKFIGKNVVINNLIAEAKEKIKSPEYNDRYDACGLLRYLINIDIDIQLTFLKSDMATKAMGVENNTITLVTEFFDADWDSLVNGQIKFEELPQEAQEYITIGGYDINNYNDRIAMLRERLYTFSNNTLTVSYNGEVLQILDKNKLVKKEYLGEKGNEKLLTDIQDGKIKKVKDICKITINETIGELDLVLDPNISSNGYFSENNPTRITIAGVNIVNTIMHEATHATQYYIRPDNVTTMSTGASLEYLQHVKTSVLNKIERYIEKTFPTTYKVMMQNPHANIPSVIYFNIDGEMQAMCKLTNLIFESGFTWNADKTKLYSPDGKEYWDLELKTNKRKSKGVIKNEKQSSSISNVTDRRDGKDTIKQGDKISKTTTGTKPIQLSEISKRFKKINGYKVTKVGEVYANIKAESDINKTIVNDGKNKYNVDVYFYDGVIYNEIGEQVTAFGFTDGNSVYMRNNLSKAQMDKVLKHEYFHIKRNQNPDIFDQLKDSFINNTSEVERDTIIEDYSVRYNGLSADEVLEEILADLCAGVLTIENKNVGEFNELLKNMYNNKSVPKVVSKAYKPKTVIKYYKAANERLMATHAFSSIKGLLLQLKRNKISAPSIAINSSLTNNLYGDMFLIFDKNTISPSEINKVYPRDSWTGRRLDQEINFKKEARSKILTFAVNLFSKVFEDTSNISTFIQRALKSEITKDLSPRYLFTHLEQIVRDELDRTSVELVERIEKARESGIKKADFKLKTDIKNFYELALFKQVLFSTEYLLDIVTVDELPDLTYLIREKVSKNTTVTSIQTTIDNIINLVENKEHRTTERNYRIYDSLEDIKKLMEIINNKTIKVILNSNINDLIKRFDHYLINSIFDVGEHGLNNTISNLVKAVDLQKFHFDWNNNDTVNLIDLVSKLPLNDLANNINAEDGTAITELSDETAEDIQEQYLLNKTGAGSFYNRAYNTDEIFNKGSKNIPYDISYSPYDLQTLTYYVYYNAMPKFSTVDDIKEHEKFLDATTNERKAVQNIRDRLNGAIRRSIEQILLWDGATSKEACDLIIKVCDKNISDTEIKTLAKSVFKIDILSENLYRDLKIVNSLYTKTLEAPAYLEAKPARNLDFNEVASIIVPKSKVPALEELGINDYLQKYNIELISYDDYYNGKILSKDIKDKKVESLLRNMPEQVNGRTVKFMKDTSQVSESRKISNEYARQSNLKYFIKKGKQIQLDERVQEFVINTTDDFNKLEPVIQKAIKAGIMTLQDIRNYVETTNSMNDYTFKMIAKYIYENEEVAKLTYKEMIEILEHLEEIDILKLFLNKSEVIDKKMSYTKMLNAYNKIKEDAKTNKKTADALVGYTNLAGTIKPANSRQFIPYEADIDQLHGAFFRHYNGTIRSVSGLNNLGKNIAHNQEALSLSGNEGEGANLKSRKSGAWNWIDRMRKADINYGNVEQLSETLNDIDRQDKINIIQEHIIQSIIEQSKINNWSQEQVLEEFNSQRDRLDDLSDNEIDKLYMAATSEGVIETTPEYMNVKTELEKRYVRKDQNEYEGKYASRITARATAKRAGRRVAQKLAGMKTRYNMLPPEVQELFDRKADGHYELNTKYQDMSDADLDAIIPKLREANRQLAERIRFVEAANKSKLNAIKRANRQAEKMLDKQIGEGKKTIREKVDVVHKVVMKQEEFDIVSREQAPKVVESVLATSWDKSRTTTVQGLNNNIDQNIANAETFYTNNTDMLNMSVAEAEQAAKWFMDAKLTGTMTSQDTKKFEAVQLYFLGYILEETRENGQFADLNHNVKTQIENFLRDKATAAGTALAVWNNIRKRLNPLEVMISQSVVIGGVELTESEQRELFTAAQQGDMETVAKLQQRALERIKKEAGTKKKFLRRVTAVRSMSMLSSPLTWLRNIVSNFMLKRLNKWSSAIGNKVFTSKGKSGQIKFTGNITPEIQKFINDNFIDNKLFETLISNISKYNPSEVSKKFKNKDGSIDKTAILANMVIKSMYGQYYSENMFKSNFMNKTYQGLMKMMSDNNYVREAAIRYFGKILADKGTDLSKGVTDQVMTDFANAIGIAMADYMHSDNFFNNLERIAADHGELTLFLYKNLLPFMATSWNWFKAGIRYSPLGLINSIIKLTRIENVVRKQTGKWKQGEAQVAPEYMEYLIRRDIGSGVIGTMAFGLGILLAALGFIDLEDDDYGVPKLVIPGTGLEVDISSIFGTSSVLAGAALIVDIRDQGLSWNTLLSGLDNALDVYVDGFFLTELMSLDMYAGGGSFATALDWAESFGLSFIPNGLAWLAGMTYTGTLRKKGFFGKAAAKIPFLAGLVNEKKVDPYTGETGNIWDIFNRVFPYFDIKMRSRAKETAESLGLSKSELRGEYKINNEEFNLSNKEVSEINKHYGEWNAKDLTAFLDNQERYKVKDDATGNYKMLTYSQMTDKQRKNTISTIMENNAENAKILAWLNAGYKYYASANKYAELRQLGVKGKLYKGNRGFVKE